MISEITSDPVNWVTLATTFPGGCALAIVFWMLLKELPAQRASREKMTEDFIASIKETVKNFREEMATERNANIAERAADRAARHEAQNLLTTAVMALNLAANHFQEHRKE